VRRLPHDPLSHLSLDVDEPIDGWMGFFGEENIEIAPDDLGRPSVPRSVLRELVDERERLRPGRRHDGLSRRRLWRLPSQPASRRWLMPRRSRAWRRPRPARS
jgi:hypothetical protein